MKTLQLSIIVLLASGLIACTTNSVYAPCLVGVTDCGPPPSVKVSIYTDSQFYEKNDTINIQGQVYVQNYSKPIHIQVINSDNATIQSIDTPVVNGKFGLKIRANFDTTGNYHIATCVQGWCDGWFFKFIAEPYKLTVNGQDFFIKYKSFADLVGMEADINSQALRVHIVNATSQGEQFVIELPRALIDSKGHDGKDASFRVFIGMHQPDKYMQPANFTEITSNDLSRKLAINIPYEPVPNSSGMWDFKIMSADTGSGPSVNYESPLKQFKSGISALDVKCPSNYALVIKAEDGSPACVRPFTVKILSEEGWSKFESTQSNHNSNAKTNPFGIVGLMYYYGGGPCGVGICPLNTFNLKMNSNYTTYLLGYNICNDNSCIVRNDLSALLPLNVIGMPNYKFIALPENPQWKYDDVFHIQVEVSSIPDNTTAVWTDLGNSTIIH